MTRQNGVQLSLAISLFFAALVLSSPARGRQEQREQQSQQPVPVPADTKPETDKDGGKGQEKEKPEETVGKSKLEKDTGTVNDRIFEVLPNYGTVENAKQLPPLTKGEKFRLATAGVFDWGAYPFNALLAGIAQAKNDPEAWGQGWGAYGKRYGASFADNSISTYMTTAIFPTLLHEDPRYYQLGQGNMGRRAYHAIRRLFVTRGDSGRERFNFSESLGNASAAAISNTYHTAEDRVASRNASTFLFFYLFDGLDYELREFWPDIRRKVFHKEAP